MHYGHANALRQAKALGDELVVRGLEPAGWAQLAATTTAAGTAAAAAAAAAAAVGVLRSAFSHGMAMEGATLCTCPPA